MHPSARACLLLLPALLGLAGCSHPGAGLEQRSEALAAELRQQHTAMAAAPAVPLAWPEALARLRADNLELAKQRDAVTAAGERLRQVRRDLIPGAALTGNLTKGLTQLGDLGGDDAAIALHAFFNVPGLLQWQLRHHAAELELIRAGWALELKERELTIRLRELFLRALLLEQRRLNLTRAEHWRPAGPGGPQLDAPSPVLEREALLWSLRREADELQAAVGELLGDAAGRWQLRPDGLPRFDYAQQPAGWTEAADFGRLHRRLQAVELEGARLREKGVRMLNWPDLTVNLSGPPLYARAGGRSDGFSADQIALSLGTSLNLDLRRQNADLLREARRDAALHARVLRENNARLLRELDRAGATLALNDRQLRLTELRLETLRGLPGRFNPARARDNLERLIALDQQRAGLLLERARLEAVFWILDETRWPSS